VISLSAQLARNESKNRILAWIKLDERYKSNKIIKTAEIWPTKVCQESWAIWFEFQCSVIKLQLFASPLCRVNKQLWTINWQWQTSLARRPRKWLKTKKIRQNEHFNWLRRTRAHTYVSWCSVTLPHRHAYYNSSVSMFTLHYISINFWKIFKNWYLFISLKKCKREPIHLLESSAWICRITNFLAIYHLPFNSC